VQKDINEILNIDDNVPFKLYRDDNYLIEAKICDGCLMDLKNEPLNHLQITIEMYGAAGLAVIASMPL